MKLYEDSSGSEYSFDILDIGLHHESTHQGIAIDIDEEQIVRIEHDVVTNKTYVYVWNGVDEDFVSKTEIKL